MERMKFEQVVTLVALAIGPTGVWFGWWLSERTEALRHKRIADDGARSATQQRVVNVVRLARQCGGDLRGLAHGTFARATGQPISGDQMRGDTDKFNLAWRQLETEIAESEILGPDWVAPGCVTIMDIGRELMEIMGRMQQRLVAADSDLVQVKLAEFDSAVDALTKSAKANLSAH